MSVTTNAEISYGVLIPEYEDMPWGDDDVETWWLHECGYEPLYEWWFDENGVFLDGWTQDDPRIQEHLDHEESFSDQYPLPVDMVNAQHIDSPQWIATVPGTRKWASRGYPSALDPSALRVDDADVQALLGFLGRYGIPYEGPPKWYLSSYSDY